MLMCRVAELSVSFANDVAGQHRERSQVLPSAHLAGVEPQSIERLSPVRDVPTRIPEERAQGMQLVAFDVLR